MFTWQTILGVVLLLYSGFLIYRGRVTSGDDYNNTTVVDREKNPVRFWLTVGGLIVVALLLVFNIIHF